MKLATITLLAGLLAGSAQAQDIRAWAVETPKGAEAWLRYATPDSDDQPVAFRCLPKSGQVQVIADISKPVRGRMPVSVTLASPPASAVLRGLADPSEITGGAIVATEFSTRAPLVAAFKKTGLVSISALGETLPLPPAPKSAVRKFFGVCK